MPHQSYGASQSCFEASKLWARVSIFFLQSFRCSFQWLEADDTATQNASLPPSFLSNSILLRHFHFFWIIRHIPRSRWWGSWVSQVVHSIAQYWFWSRMDSNHLERCPFLFKLYLIFIIKDMQEQRDRNPRVLDNTLIPNHTNLDVTLWLSL